MMFSLNEVIVLVSAAAVCGAGCCWLVQTARYGRKHSRLQLEWTNIFQQLERDRDKYAAAFLEGQMETNTWQVRQAATEIRLDACLKDCAAVGRDLDEWASKGLKWNELRRELEEQLETCREQLTKLEAKPSLATGAAAGRG